MLCSRSEIIMCFELSTIFRYWDSNKRQNISSFSLVHYRFFVRMILDRVPCFFILRKDVIIYVWFWGRFCWYTTFKDPWTASKQNLCVSLDVSVTFLYNFFFLYLGCLSVKHCGFIHLWRRVDHWYITHERLYGFLNLLVSISTCVKIDPEFVLGRFFPYKGFLLSWVSLCQALRIVFTRGDV